MKQVWNIQTQDVKNTTTLHGTVLNYRVARSYSISQETTISARCDIRKKNKMQENVRQYSDGTVVIGLYESMEMYSLQFMSIQQNTKGYR